MKNGRNRGKPKTADRRSSDIRAAGTDFNPDPAPRSGCAASSPSWSSRLRRSRPLPGRTRRRATAARRRANERTSSVDSHQPGRGVQSLVMALMASGGASDRMPDCVVFADARWEPPGVYDRIEGLKTRLRFPLHVVHNVRSLCEDVKAVRRQAERPPEGRGTDRCAPQHNGPRGAGHDAEPLPEPARQGDRGQPRMHGNAGQRQAHAFRPHPPSDAEGPWGGRLRRPFQIGG